MVFNRALCHHYSRHYSEAKADFDLVLHATPNDVEALCGRAASLGKYSARQLSTIACSPRSALGLIAVRVVAQPPLANLPKQWRTAMTPLRPQMAGTGCRSTTAASLRSFTRRLRYDFRALSRLGLWGYLWRAHLSNCRCGATASERREMCKVEGQTQAEDQKAKAWESGAWGCRFDQSADDAAASEEPTAVTSDADESSNCARQAIWWHMRKCNSGPC